MTLIDNTPAESEVWQHRKHDPAAGKFHQYTILCVTESTPHPDRPMPQYFSAKHTETGEVLNILYDGQNEF
ncbi:MAG: hypothetical protein AAF773_00795 [Cyanobacteria bacterium P01_D01_bin.115]